jgi:hypothetical protein
MTLQETRMRKWDLEQWILILLFVLFLAWLQGCPFSWAPRIDSQKLPGTWRTTLKDAEVAWTLWPDGSMHLHVEARNAWLRFFGGQVVVRGRWKLQGDQLTVEFTETPPLSALLGENWTSDRFTLGILRLTDEELVLADTEQPFRRDRPPAK